MTTQICPDTLGSMIRDTCYEKTLVNRGDCLDEPFNTTIMSWAAKPVLSTGYSLRSGTGQDVSQDATEYQPDKWMTITLKTLEYDKKYRGMLLHADNANNDKVGEWGLSEAQMFWHPPVCGPRAVLHAGAAVKQLTNHFRFKGPPTGTGAITFKVLVKVGTCELEWCFSIVFILFSYCFHIVFYCFLLFSIVFYCFLLFSIVFSAVFATVFGSALGLFLTRRRWSHRAAPLRPHLCAVFLRGVDRPPPLARDRGGARARERGWCDDAGPRGQFLYKK